MKKVLLTAAALFAISFANAQETKFGIKGGLNLADMTNIHDSSMKVGFHVGGFAEIKLDEKFAIQPELIYSTQGAKFEAYEINNRVVEMKINLSYLNVPIMARYYANEKLSLEAGPQIGFLLSAEGESSFTSEGFDKSQDIKKLFETTDFGLNLGLGYDITENFSAGVRYNIGLSKLQKELDGEGSKNSVLQFSVGYKF